MVRSVLRLWALALMLSAALAAAGERWPAPLVPQPLLVFALVLGLPVVMLVWLTVHWQLPSPVAAAAGEGGESPHTDVH